MATLFVAIVLALRRTSKLLPVSLEKLGSQAQKKFCSITTADVTDHPFFSDFISFVDYVLDKLYGGFLKWRYHERIHLMGLSIINHPLWVLHIIYSINSDSPVFGQLVVVKIYSPVGHHKKKWYISIVHFVHSLGFVTIPRKKVTAEWRRIKKGVLDYWGITCVERIVIHRCHQPGSWPNYTRQPKGFVCVKPFFCIWRSTFGNGWTKTTSQLLFGCLTLP